MLARIEHTPITVLHLILIGLCACGFAIDLLELALGGALAAIFSAAPYRLTPIHLSWVVSSVYFGAIVGAPVFGWLADKIGPRKVLCLAIFWCGIASLLSALAATPSQLAIVRLIGGVGLGAYPPLMITYLTDISPSRRRGAVIFSTCALAYLAPPLALFAVRWLTPIAPLGIEGWRWPFAMAGLVAIGTGIGFLKAPEAPHWLATAGHSNDLQRVTARFTNSLRVGFLDKMMNLSSEKEKAPLIGSRAWMLTEKIGSSRLRLLVLCLISFTVPIATVSFPLITGPILMARHFSLQDTLFYIGLATFGPVIGTFLCGLFVDRVARRTFLVTCGAAMLASVGVFFLLDDTVAMTTALIGFAMLTSLYVPTMTMYGAELFPPSVRGRATSLAWVANRIAAAGAPAILIPLIHMQMVLAVGLVLGVALAVNVTIIVLFAPREIRDQGEDTRSPCVSTDHPRLAIQTG